MKLKPGSRWKSAVDTVEIVVVRAPATDVELACGGHTMIPLGEEPAQGLEIDPRFATGTAVGKRYADSLTGLEILGSKGGQGAVSVDGRLAELRQAKALPASD